MTSEKTVSELIRNNKGIAGAAAIFTLLSIMYFFPPSDLKAGLPDFIVDYRVAWPLLTLTIASCFLVSWPIDDSHCRGIQSNESKICLSTMRMACKHIVSQICRYKICTVRCMADCHDEIVG